MKILEWLTQNNATVPTLIAAISTLIAAITAIIAFYSTQQNRKQYQESIQPQLSMGLIEYDSWL